ncbi:hypothetical protein ISN44_As06g011880 [Arabidopsis suecica]|uniref:Uncharacterized protein n=1 Tax=Arabidopsis suecica TaxID=45249 RepID=A0A8T2CP47_ARASU|nr:hypothetical protein ISN44_As06g011880 [Arabidopsis suecica]
MGKNHHPLGRRGGWGGCFGPMTTSKRNVYAGRKFSTCARLYNLKRSDHSDQFHIQVIHLIFAIEKYFCHLGFYLLNSLI